MAQIHDLKILPEYYTAVEKGVKTYELRFDDRNYAVGDMLILREWENGQYTGRRLTVLITHILKDFVGLTDGWAVLSIKKQEAKSVKKSNLGNLHRGVACNRTLYPTIGNFYRV